jgi:lysophospholipase L1-like esterase
MPTVPILLLLLAAVLAAETPAPVNPAFAPVADRPELPRVLLIGDSISIGYTLPVRALLRDVANVHRPPENCASTLRGLERLENWLGETKWDAIHFNFGLHDSFIEDGKHPVPLEEYERNLRRIVARLREAGAKLIWASTTPIAGEVLLRPRAAKPVHDFYARDIYLYNAAAARVMEENGVQVNDLYRYALPRLAEIQNPGDVHFNAGGSDQLAAQAATAIRKALGVK